MEQEPKDVIETTEPNDKEQQPEGKTFSREELAKIVSSQTQKAVEKFQQEQLPDLLKDAQEKAAAEAKMSAEQLAEKHRKEQEAQLAEREEQLNRRAAELETKAQLADSGLPASMADTMLPLLSGMDEDSRLAMITKTEDAIKQAAHEEVLKKTEGKKTPSVGGSPVNITMTREKWDSLNYTEQLKIYREDPETANKFM